MSLRWLVVPCLVLCLLPGCALVDRYLGEPTPAAVDDLVAAYRAPTIDGQRVRRVLVLPFQDASGHPEQIPQVQRALVDALNRRQVFEAVCVPADALGERGEEEFLLTGLVRQATLLRMAERYHADGVLYGTVTRYRPYEPMAVGLRVTLVSAGAGDRVWEAHGLFDAEDERVARDLHNFYDTRLNADRHLEGWRCMLISPTRFTGYACTRLADTW